MDNLVPSAEAFAIEIKHRYGGSTTFFVKAANAIPIGAMPTAEEVCNETRRLHQIQYARENGGLVTDEQYCDAVVRHHRVVSVRSGMWNDASLQSLLQGQAAILQGVQQINARLNANSARHYNSHVDRHTSRHAPYAPVVKYTPGHPFDHPVAVPNVQFAQQYLLDSPPPINLVPATYDELQQFRDNDDTDAVRQRLMGIYWFYNDPKLMLGHDADILACRGVIDALDYFLKNQ